MARKPPSVFEKLADWLCGEGMFCDIPGDMREEFDKNSGLSGWFIASVKYAYTALTLIRPFILRDKFSRLHLSVWTTLYIENIRVYYRSLRKSPLISILNVGGITLGYAVCWMVFCYVHHELTFESHLEDRSRLFRVELTANMPKRFFESVKTSEPLIDILRTKYPEIETAGRLREPVDVTFEYQGIYRKVSKCYFVEPEILDIFSVQMVEGNIDSFGNPDHVFITRDFSNDYFDGDRALDREIMINGSNLKVAGIVETPPSNTHFKYNILRPIPNTFRERVRKDPTENWLTNNTLGYIKLKQGIDPGSFESKIEKIADQYYREELESLDYTLTHFLRPVRDIHLKAHNIHELELPGNVTTIYIAAFTGFIILCIVIMNFINHLSVIYLRRSNEFAIRSILGGGSFHQLKQSFAESILALSVILILSYGIAFIGLIYVNQLLDLQLRLPSLLTWNLIVIILVIVIVTGIVTSILSSRHIISNRIPGNRSCKAITPLYKGLSIFMPFAISLVLIIISITVFLQVNFMMIKDMGFNKSNKIVVDAQLGSTNEKEHYKRVKDAFDHPYVIDVTASWSTPGDRYTAFFTSSENVTDRLLNYLFVDEDFIDTYKISVIHGEGISDKDSLNNLVLSGSSLSKFGWGSPAEAVGKIVEVGTSVGIIQARVTGIMKEINYRGLQHELEPIGLLYMPEYFKKLTFTVDENHFTEAVAAIEKSWKALELGEYFDYRLLSRQIHAHYRTEANLNVLTLLLSIISLILSCIGLINFISLNNSEKLKEIGIRKVFGASKKDIYGLISRDYLLNTLLAITLACPLAYILMEIWLDSFAFRINLSLTPFAVAIALVIFILIATSSYQTIKIIHSSPVDAIKNE